MLDTTSLFIEKYTGDLHAKHTREK